MIAAKSSFDALIRNKEIEDRRHESLAFGQLQLLHGYIADQNARMICPEKVIVFPIAEIRKADGNNSVLHIRERQAKLRLVSV